MKEIIWSEDFLIEQIKKVPFLYNVLSKLAKNKMAESFIDPDMEADAVELIKFALPYTMTYVQRMYALYQAVKFIEQNNIEGDIVECGVWKGGSCMLVAKMLAQLGKTNRKIYMYDTFEGMVRPTDKDVEVRDSGVYAKDIYKSMKDKNEFYAGTKNWAESPLDEVKANMEKTGYPMQNIIFVQGKVEDTIPTNHPQKIALLRLDTDWFDSTWCEMNYLYPKLAEKGVLIIDDYGHWQGAKDAVDKYFQENNINLLLNKIDYSGRLAIKI